MQTAKRNRNTERARVAFAHQMGVDPHTMVSLAGFSGTHVEDEVPLPVLTAEPEIPFESLRADTDIDEVMCLKDDLRRVTELCAQLTEKEQDILHRRFVEEQTLDEIRAVYGISKSYMSETIQGILGKLRKLYAQ